ncbi:MAG: protein-tyrosine-phosphatase [Acidobacteria bacterium RIFCSPLOWO2_02_FULL_59_13]|nr:MAG: protein-tyrosine-phosphatase [Acidobacteria bacterium RIFCSPLOWO2_02_FULL_59_13]
MPPVKVLFLCTGNSCRSQMAEGLLRHMGGAVIQAASAGTTPRPVHPDAIRCMQEIGIDISAQQSKSLAPFLQQQFDYVVTVCDRARQSCPVFPVPSESLHWSIPDPAEAQGSEAERLEIFRQVRDDLAARIRQLLEEIERRSKTRARGTPPAAF